MPSRVIWTIGHSTRTADNLLALLEASSVALVVDVRKYPMSRRMPHFNRDEFARFLEAAGVGYRHFEALGGRRDRTKDEAARSCNHAWRVEAFNAYADHASTPAFEQALGELEVLATSRRTAVMCAEALPWQCHRRLIADALIVRGWTVFDIIAAGKVERHALTPFARVEGTCVTYPQLPLFQTSDSRPGSDDGSPRSGGPDVRRIDEV